MQDRAMTWAEVARRLAAARNYWLGTTTVSGAPHAAPVWGVVAGETLYLSASGAPSRPVTSRPTRGLSFTWKAARTS